MESLFLTNYSEQTFLDKIKQSLRTCQSFCFSVSFIKRAGLVLLSQDIKAAIERGVIGKLITTTYQNFTDVESLKFFLGLASHPNFECHLDFDCFYDEKNYEKYGFHSKGYLFDYGLESELVIGSSNITRFALLKNIEWDMMLKVPNDNETLLNAKEEFDRLWEKTLPLDTALIDKYAQRLNFAIERWDMDYDLASHEIKPNYMQRKALRELNRYRAMGQDRALVIAATGSGKTYLAAFDALNFAPEQLLYIVHEGSILRKSLQDFQKVFGGEVFMGEYTGEHKDLDAPFLFSTNVSMCRSLELFDKKQFDYIIIDECHHAAAESYKKIIDYFEPEFLLGLTATPERMDNQDVYELFGNNVPYELRLRDALVNDLIVPFRYYGIRDDRIDFSKENERRMISQFVKNAPERTVINTHDDLEFFQNAFVEIDSLGRLSNRAIGIPLTLFDPDTTHLYVGVDSLEEALRFWDHSLAPDIERTQSVAHNYTYTLKDKNGNSQGTVTFAQGTENGHIAEITTDLPGLKHFKHITFLANSYWPPLNSGPGKYRLGDSRREKMVFKVLKNMIKYVEWVDYELEMTFVCVREKGNGVKPLYVAITPKEYYPYRGSDPVANGLCRSKYCPAETKAVMISKLFQDDWEFYKACFDEADVGKLTESDFYWYDDSHDYIVYMTWCCINLRSGELDDFDLNFHSPEKHILLKIDWEDD